jgi:hypothetical protein
VPNRHPLDAIRFRVDQQRDAADFIGDADAAIGRA